MRIIPKCVSEYNKKEFKTFSYEEIKKDEGIYKALGGHDSSRFIVTHAYVLYNAPIVTILHYNAEEKYIEPCVETYHHKKKFVKTDEQIYMEVK